jgi:hypothetical protein
VRVNGGRKELDTRSGVVPGLVIQASREATDDSDRATGQTGNVVPDGARQMAGVVAGEQSLQSRAVESAEKRIFPDFFPTTPLAVSGEVLQMLRFGMHDVEMGRQECENRILRAGRQSAAKLVFRLDSLPLTVSKSRLHRNALSGAPDVSRQSCLSIPSGRGSRATFG